MRIVNWGINEPMVYFGNVYGELDALGIQPGTLEAARFAIGANELPGGSATEILAVVEAEED